MSWVRLAALALLILLMPGLIGLTAAGQDFAVPAVKARESADYSPNTAWELGYSGKGVNIAVLDTGVDNEHPAFPGKFVAGADFTKREGFLGIRPMAPARDGTHDPDDMQGHGTTCASIALGTGDPDGTYMGVAPDAKLLDLRVGTAIGFSVGGTAQDILDSIRDAIYWAIDHRESDWPGQPDENDGIDVITISFWGGDTSDSDGSDVYSRALDAAAEAGLIVVTIAGNAGPDNAAIGSISASEGAITVAALDDNDTVTREDDVIAEYSSRGPRRDDGDDDPYDELIPDIAAPGTSIVAAQYSQTPGGASSNGYENRGSGTSYAGPNVAGIAALMLEANPDLDQDLVKGILLLTAETVEGPTFPDLDPKWNREYGYGMADAYKAVVSARDLEDRDMTDTGIWAWLSGVGDGDNMSGRALITGNAWNRYGDVDAVQVRIDDGEWMDASDVSDGGDESENGTRAWWNWSVRIDTAKYGGGEHRLYVRATMGEKHSLYDWRDVSFEEGTPVGEVLDISPGIALTGVLMALIAYVYLRRKVKRSASSRGE